MKITRALAARIAVRRVQAYFWDVRAIIVVVFIVAAAVGALTTLGLRAQQQQTPAPGSVYLSPVRALDLETQMLEVPPQFRSFVPARAVSLPRGWKAKVFYAGALLSKPRFMAWSPDSVLHIADMSAGRIIALPDRDRDGVADTAVIAASNVFAHDLKFYNGAMYAAEERRVLRFASPDRFGVYRERATFIDNIAEGATQPGGGHRTRTIAFNAATRKMYLSIGSLCNVCREDFRAIIEEWNDDGTGRRTFATGVRNAVGMTVHPRTGKLWAANNGSDWQGNDIPPEWIDVVRDGGFYGYPFAHSYQAYFNFAAGSADYRALLPITAADSARVRSMRPPAALITAHSAPMALHFAHDGFPEPFRRGAFLALRGSWNRQPLTGYKVVYLDFNDDSDTVAASVADFLTGFLTDSIRGERWARPVGLESDARGNLYVGSDDITRFVLILSPPATAVSAPVSPPARGSLRITPNPSSAPSLLKAVFTLPSPSRASLHIYDALGRRIQTLRQGFFGAGEHEISIPDEELQNANANGTFFCRLETENGAETAPFSRLR
jgi:glucose/arabinose dehydrogenase